MSFEDAQDYDVNEFSASHLRWEAHEKVNELIAYAKRIELTLDMVRAHAYLVESVLHPYCGCSGGVLHLYPHGFQHMPQRKKMKMHYIQDEIVGFRCCLPRDLWERVANKRGYVCVFHRKKKRELKI